MKHSFQLGCHVSLHAFNILKPLSFERSFHLKKEKMQSRKVELSWQVWIKPRHDLSCRCFCSSVSFCGMNLFRKSWWRIWRIVSLFLFNSSENLLRVNRSSHVTISRTSASVCISRGRETPLLGSASRSSRPSLKRREFATIRTLLLASYPLYNKIWYSLVAPRLRKKWRQLKTQLSHWAATHELSVTGPADPCQLLVRARTTLHSSSFHHHVLWLLQHQSGKI
jgi:hypothetical protein